MDANLTPVELYETDYVIMLKPGGYEFLRFNTGEIIIYGDLQTATKDAKEVDGSTASCTQIFQYKQDLLKENIKTHRLINSKKNN